MGSHNLQALVRTFSVGQQITGFLDGKHGMFKCTHDWLEMTSVTLPTGMSDLFGMRPPTSGRPASWHSTERSPTAPPESLLRSTRSAGGISGSGVGQVRVAPWARIARLCDVREVHVTVCVCVWRTDARVRSARTWGARRRGRTLLLELLSQGRGVKFPQFESELSKHADRERVRQDSVCRSLTTPSTIPSMWAARDSGSPGVQW